jgi:hypothetical protein
MWTISDLKNNAKIVMQQNYWLSVLAAFLYATAIGGGGSVSSYGSNSAVSESGSEGGLSSGGFNPAMLVGLAFIVLLIVLISIIIGIVMSLFVFYPLEVSCQRFFISARTAPGDISLLTFAFKNSYWNVIKTQFMRYLCRFLWGLLLIVPGIIKGYEYRMMPYILAENPGMDTNEVFARSKEMMTGQKWNAFVLDLSFLGWHILGIFTCGLLQLFYINPYQQLTNAELYEALR